MAGLTEAEDISDIAFAYMGSKALFAAIKFDIFTTLAAGPLDAGTLAQRVGLPTERCRTLMTALTSLDLTTVDDDGTFANSPAAAAFLVKGAKYDFSDYLERQVGQQMYPLMDQIDDALSGDMAEDATDSYDKWFSDPEEARLYSESQHAGSLGPARGLAKRVDLSGVRTLLDVGGGTGAFAITLCKANPDLTATVIDFPNVAALGETYVADAGLSDRVTYRHVNALEGDWPDGQDAILMSYLFSGVPDHAHEGLIAKAFAHLAPGGRLLIHDFVVDADLSGPKNTALWQLQHTAFTPEARSLDDDWLAKAIETAGFTDVAVGPLIPGMTKLAQGTRP
ncbi:ubiquinone/menaquinone biosynthesis C-methylase UbiE [Maritimibacter alkaliphilus HTCC2654]|uniref:Tetracenomycin polyketide synthesis 8-o-methyltransferase, putative n=1 Tax=Maritimibacter alkaliphilus HTCC2654 TaxID=314271 RepID=A3VL58_9RHOB|nr:methyltransferase [Maritimibacter alkaliphilus]EAQ10977.1 tetracenomycin polyketide synthesis 8-o-methyltransferase, putative [Rhodobacterales bacterium HTCC2654] [Maritimibacter alkaliphilus HTCC2654]TYP82337.1 ubiquinone/menaquinone biosynthesis C-methylase UbiE [Maritimibacter alkaliphilus HTCC2654]